MMPGTQHTDARLHAVHGVPQTREGAFYLTRGAFRWLQPLTLGSLPVCVGHVMVKEHKSTRRALHVAAANKL